MPQNAAQLNRMQIREQEALNRQRRMQDDAVARREEEELRRTKAQYDHVSSHGYGRAGSGAAAPSGSRGASDEVQIRVYVRECDEEASRSFSYREDTAANSTSHTGPRSGASASTSAASHVARRGVNGALPPIGSSGRLGPPRAPGARAASGGGGGTSDISGGAASCGVVAPNRARVPRYLQQRKAELAAEKEAIAAEAEKQRQLSLIPAGQRRVSEEEKADTLRQLDERQQELEGQLARIPIRFDTQSIQQRRRAIEEELRQIETTRNKYNTKGTLFMPLC
ncbi:Calmodulin binding protein [Leishmania donovani]|uniref:Calmodulin-binding family protein n=1 Tax=Leishmania donovani TaxID=5661 RepID=A0A504XJX6_LEIDO|nr:Calmodulin-binding family protein [Leishmania donovani]CAJ1985611.1 Calmodulin binding protein [Leishmania donovani]VDZ41516.1 Calmodulin-binding_putative/Pfam:PF13864 [Leishmania donovani]